MAKPFRSRNPERFRKMIDEERASIELIRLNDLRKARHIMQADLASRLGIAQSEVSRIERRSDILLSTLAKFVAATGGRLEVRAVYPDNVEFMIERFSDLDVALTQAATKRKTALA